MGVEPGGDQSSAWQRLSYLPVALYNWAVGNHPALIESLRGMTATVSVDGSNARPLAAEISYLASKYCQRQLHERRLTALMNIQHPRGPTLDRVVNATTSVLSYAP